MYKIYENTDSVGDIVIVYLWNFVSVSNLFLQYDASIWHIHSFNIDLVSVKVLAGSEWLHLIRSASDVPDSNPSQDIDSPIEVSCSFAQSLQSSVRIVPQIQLWPSNHCLCKHFSLLSGYCMGYSLRYWLHHYINFK